MDATITFEEYLALTDLKSAYFQHLDAKRWSRLHEVFTPDATFEGFAFESDGGREDFIATVSAFLADVESQHQGFNPRFRRISADVIRGVWGMHDYLTWELNSRTYKGIKTWDMWGLRGWGVYEEEYCRTPDGWRISFSRLARTRIDALVEEGIVNPPYDLTSPDPDWLTILD